MNMPYTYEDYFKQGKQKLDELQPIWQALSHETDRTTAILSASVLDDLLEKLIRASFIKNTRVNSIFKDDHILQSFFAKINITYFSGLKPEVFYHDLKLIGEIRNRFAHSIVADLEFTHETISQRIDKFSQIPKHLAELYPPRLRFVLMVSHIAGLLLSWEAWLLTLKPPNLVELIKSERIPFENFIITPEQIQDIIGRTNK